MLLLGFNSSGHAWCCNLGTDYKPVCYYVASNEVKGYGDDPMLSMREIRILVDETDFTENNLKALAQYFFENYAQPEGMRVYVNTHISQMYDFSTTEGKEKKPSELHPYGAIFRKDGNEFIRYKLPDHSLSGITIKGEDPLHISQESFIDFSRNSTDAAETIHRSSAPVCYYVVSNDLIGKQREVNVFIDEADFTEDALRKLASHFFERYLQPDWIEVKVQTHTSQLFDHPGIRGAGKKQAQLHPYGFLRRKDHNELIRYKLPGSNLQTIVIKGEGR